MLPDGPDAIHVLFLFLSLFSLTERSESSAAEASSCAGSQPGQGTSKAVPAQLPSEVSGREGGTVAKAAPMQLLTEVSLHGTGGHSGAP